MSLATDAPVPRRRAKSRSFRPLKSEDAIDLPSAEFGAAMLALEHKQRLFVQHYIVCGVGSEACRRAGYGNPATTTNESYANMSYVLRTNARVVAAINEEACKWYRSAMAKAVREAHRILDDPTAKNADKLRAIDGILARCDPIISGQFMRMNTSILIVSTIPRLRSQR